MQVIKEQSYDVDESDHSSVGVGDSTDYESSSGSSRGGPFQHAGGAGTKNPQGSQEGIARAEDKAVFRSRLLIIAFLAICTVTVGTLVFLDTRKAEEEKLESDFSDLASKIFESLGSSTQASIGAIDAFVVSIDSFAKNNGMEWPYVTIPDFGVRASKVRAVSRSTIISKGIFVTVEQEAQWNNYSLQEGPGWVESTRGIQRKDPGYGGIDFEDYSISPIWSPFPPEWTLGQEFLFPTWQAYPVLPIDGGAIFNFDMSILPSVIQAMSGMSQRLAIVSGVSNDPYTFTTADDTSEHLARYLDTDLQDPYEPVSELMYPIFDDASDDLSGTQDGKLVAFLGCWFYWRDYLVDILPSGSDGVVVVFENKCNQTFSYQIDGPEAKFLGNEDAHDSKYDNLGVSEKLLDIYQEGSDKTYFTGAQLSDEVCPYTVLIYPSASFEENYITSAPILYTGVAVAIFVFTTLVFVVYDILVERRQKKVMTTAVKSSAIVSSLFPSNVRARLYGSDDIPDTTFEAAAIMPGSSPGISDRKLHGAAGGIIEQSISTGRPIADLFPTATVMFGDIAGFTAWSSTRQPHQVFILLESLYGLFDTIADRRGVFKVETIGDCYMAVAGLPDPRPDHAVVCTKFAFECCKRMVELTARLALTLGPDTEELNMRFGLNSGPVTAGVLRGQKTRFQLFGDTVNTASRMESTGHPNRIQASESTATELRKYKKGHWLRKREDQVEVKGKGQMTTFWVNPNERATSTSGSDGNNPSNLSPPDLNSGLDPKSEIRIDRLIDWNTEVLSRLLRTIEARRLSCDDDEVDTDDSSYRSLPWDDTGLVKKMILDEVQEIVPMAKFTRSKLVVDPDTIVLDPKVLAQLREYVASIADVYAHFDNPFHNFEHASHVCMSVSKLMSRIVAGDDSLDNQNNRLESNEREFAKHERTFGITSDPLTIFASAFSALIHDVDHQGVPNSQLVKEETSLALQYHNRSVAEQHSIDVAWSLLLSHRFSELRHAIAPSAKELQRFRQLVVNTVMATDIMDKDLKTLRNERWDRAFNLHQDKMKKIFLSTEEDARNRKATIVIEHLIQASDVAHTMQHWHVYRKWNERLFEEMSKAYQDGRSEKDPAEFWYKGELGFFDFYILPLAKKLSECGVFGVSSDEYLNYALKNREEWELKGKDIVKGMVKKRQSSQS